MTRPSHKISLSVAPDKASDEVAPAVIASDVPKSTPPKRPRAKVAPKLMPKPSAPAKPPQPLAAVASLPAPKPVGERLHPAARHPRTAQYANWLLPLGARAIAVMVGAGLLAALRGHQAAVLPPYPARVGALGQHFYTGLYTISATGYKEITQDPAFAPAAGSAIGVTTVSVKNNDNQPHQFYPALHTYVRDDEGVTYPMHPTVMLQQPLPAGMIAPGATVTGELSYEVPQRAGRLRLYIDPAWNGTGPVVFQLRPAGQR